MPPLFFLEGTLPWPPPQDKVEQYEQVLELTVPNWRRNFRRAVRRYNKGLPVDDRYQELIKAIYGKEAEWREVRISIHMQGTTGGRRPWNMDYECTLEGTVPADMTAEDIIDEFGGMIEVRLVDALGELGVEFDSAEPIFEMGVELGNLTDQFSSLVGQATLINNEGHMYGSGIGV